MTNDDDPPDNVIPFGHELRFAIAAELRKMYESFLREELPERIVRLMRRFDEATKDNPGPTG
jgi:hypothetical protein